MKLRIRSIILSAVCMSWPFALSAQVDVQAQQDHINNLADQANKAAAAFGEKTEEMSAGANNFFAFGAKAPILIKALGPPDRGVNNPLDPSDFISRLAGNTQSEETAAWCGINALIAFNDSGSFVRTLTAPVSPSGSFSFVGWAQSTNAGATFGDRGILISDPPGYPLPAGIRFRDMGGDPVASCVSSTVFYLAGLATDTTTARQVFSGISVSKSTNGGSSFQGAVMASRKSATNHFLDKPWMTAEGNTVHVTYTDFFVNDPRCPGPAGTPGVAIEYVRSTDGGTTWSATPTVLDVVCGATPFVQGSQIATGPAGVVYAAWEYFPNGMGPGRAIRLRKSTNGGDSFQATTTVTSVTAIGDGRRVQGLFRTFIDLQGLAVDRTTDRPTSGNVYVIWHDGRNNNQADPFSSPGCAPARYCFADVLLSRSTTGGSAWSAPVKVNNDTAKFKDLLNVDHYFPAMAVDGAGRIRAVFYDRRRDARNFLMDAVLATSVDGGGSWSNELLTSTNFPAIHAEDLVVNPTYMGDYLGIAFDRLTIHPGVIAAWGDNSFGDPNVTTAKRVP
jgi:hypothetical protein